MDKNDRQAVDDATDAVGIVVQNGRSTPARPRTAGFVWGVRMYAPPSLPFGRWKVPVRSPVG
jgi:hypothetical protein